MADDRTIVKGRVVEVDILERGVGFVLSIGPVSLWLGPAVVVDVLETLARALATEHRADASQAPAADPPGALRRRNFS
jgi:hypothetical protein